VFSGHWEIVLVFLVIVLLFGAKKLPGLARSLGKSLSEFRKGREEGESGKLGDGADGED
jgi:sec-independent protein translocase protein TatA